MTISGFDIEHSIKVASNKVTTTIDNKCIAADTMTYRYKALMLAHIKDLYDKTLLYNPDGAIADIIRKGYVLAMKEYLSIERDYN